MEVARCPDCGATVEGGREGCQALYDQLALAALENPNRARFGTLVFDAYCMQHLERYCLSARSYAAHLTRLCCGLEYGGKPQVYAAIQRWLNTAKPAKPPPLTFLGSLTIADLAELEDDKDYEQKARLYAEDVWQAYRSQQDLARGWIQGAQGNKS